MIMKYHLLSYKSWLVWGLLIILSSNRVFAQQDAQFSQYIFNGLYINPAYAGYKEVTNLHAFYRNQFTGIEGGPKTMSLTLDATANENRVGLALQLVSDKLGAQNNTSIFANYAYRIRLNEDGSSRLAIGISGGLAQFRLDGSKLISNDPEIDLTAAHFNELVPDARVGVFFASNKYFAGISASNLISSQYKAKFRGSARPVIHSYVTAGMLIPLSADVQLKPSFLIKEDFNGPTNLDINMFLLFKELIWVGGSYRSGMKLFKHSKELASNLSRQNSVVAAIEIFPQNNIRIGYAYDISVGPLRPYSGGTHEISLAYQFRRADVRMANPRVF
jgi:type IX secretion system PorP/SprF family membrane protein